MENVYIDATKSSPEIRFDAAQQILAISGESYPEDTAEFYQPIVRILQEALQHPDQPFTLNLDLAYANSSSSKILLDILDLLDEASSKGKTVTVNWYYDPENDTALESGEEFAEDLEHLAFHLIAKGIDDR